MTQSQKDALHAAHKLMSEQFDAYVLAAEYDSFDEERDTCTFVPQFYGPLTYALGLARRLVLRIEDECCSSFVDDGESDDGDEDDCENN